MRWVWPSIRVASSGRPSVRASRMRVEDTSPSQRHHRRHADAEAQALAQPRQPLRVARTAMAEAEVPAYDGVAEAQAVGQHLRREPVGRQRGQRRVERHLVEDVHAQARQPRGAGGGRHEPEGRAVGGEVLARMGLEGDDAQGRAEPLGLRARDVDDRLMAPMHAVEVPDGGGCASVPDIRPGAVDPHPGGVSPPRCACKRGAACQVGAGAAAATGPGAGGRGLSAGTRSRRARSSGMPRGRTAAARGRGRPRAASRSRPPPARR